MNQYDEVVLSGITEYVLCVQNPYMFLEESDSVLGPVEISLQNRSVNKSRKK